MPRKSPQQKKRESYQKDRRNTYGENSKSSRKGIRRRKRTVSRSNRRAANQVLVEAEAVAPERDDLIDQKLEGKRRKVWTKAPDQPLAEVVKKKLHRRVRLGMDSEATVRAKVKRINRRARRDAS